MLFRGRRLIKTCFVSILQQLFTNHPKFPWLPKVLDTKIFIDEEYQKSDKKFPYIIVNNIAGNEFFSKSYDRNFQHEDYNNDNILIGQRYGGSMKPSLKLEIGSLNIYDLEIIVDLIESFFEFAGVQKLRDAGIVIESITDDGITTEQHGKENIYILNMNFNIYTEWEKYILQDELNTINAVKIGDISLYDNTGKVIQVDKVDNE